MSAPKTQHWLPQLYLRSFATVDADHEEPRVWVFFRDGPDAPRLMRPKEIAARNYLYSPKNADGTRDRSVEQKLGELEGVLGQVWPAVATGMVDLVRPALRKVLALFLSTMYLRNPQRLGDHSAIHKTVADILTGGQASPNPVRAPRAPPRRETSPFEQVFVSAIVNQGRRLAEPLLRKRWAIVAADSPAFATCDAPVVLHGVGDAPFSFGLQGTSIHFPLSPTRFLIIDDEDLPSGYYSSKPGFPEAMNYQIWTAADRYLISSVPSDAVLQGVMAFADQHGLS